MMKKFIVIFLTVFSSLACNLISAPPTTEVEQVESASAIPPTLEEMPNYVLTGTYATQTYDNGAVCVLEVKGEPELQFYVNCNRGGPSYNQGTISGQFQLTEPNVGDFKTDAFGVCELRFDFNESGVEVTQTGADFECGFGAGVVATGSYTYQTEATPNIP